MTTQDHPNHEGSSDTSQVVEGPVGSASLKPPTEAEPFGADLDALPTVEDTDEPASSTDPA